jgi:competence protein ComEC
VNPAGFDYEAWLLARGIGATGSVKAGEKLSGSSGIGVLRDRVRSALLAEDAYGRAGALAALIVGDGSGISTGEWKLLQDTGTVHLMVISGQHVSMMAGMAYALVFGLVKIGLWPRRWPWLPCACLFAFISAVTYAFMAGFGVPVRRACVMIAFVLLWRWRFRQLGILTPLLVALNVVLLAEPLAVLQPGFWLSFGAVATLAAAFAGRLGTLGVLTTAWRAQWTVTIGLLILMLALDLAVSVTSPFANLIAVPWVGLAIVPLALAGCLLLPIPWVGSMCLWIAGWLLDILFNVLGYIASILPAWIAPGIPWWGWILGSVGTLCLLLPSGAPGRMLGGLLLLPLLYPPVSKVGEGRADIWMLDIGQGLSVLVRTRDHALLYDAGPKFGDFDLGERVVLPNVKALSVKALDHMLLSHADADHAGGALALHSAMPVRHVSSGEHEALPQALGAVPCRNGSWTWNHVVFTTWRYDAAASSNASSCVLKVEANGEAILLTGDIDIATEQLLVESGFAVGADWLQVGHHGSKSSTGPRFVHAVSPKIGLVSRGKQNAYGHPHPDVIERLTRHDVRIVDTAETGAIQIRLGDRVEPYFSRESGKVFWR